MSLLPPETSKARLPSCTSFGISILLPHQTMKLWALDVFPSPMSQTLATVLPQTNVVLGLSQQKAGDRNWSRHRPWTPLTGLLSCFPTQPWTTCTKVASRLMNCALPYPSKQCPTNLPSGKLMDVFVSIEISLPRWLYHVSSWQKNKQK